MLQADTLAWIVSQKLVPDLTLTGCKAATIGMFLPISDGKFWNYTAEAVTGMNGTSKLSKLSHGLRRKKDLQFQRYDIMTVDQLLII